jgi:hypothetical protein
MKPADRSHPEKAIAVFLERPHRVASQRRSVSGNMSKYFEGVSVVPVQSIRSTEPKKALAILGDAPDRAL